MSDFRGRYRNHVGAEIEIVGLYRPSNIGFLGTFYEGRSDSIFGRELIIVEPAALKDCGYVKLEPAE